MNRYDQNYRSLLASMPPPHNASLRVRQSMAEIALVQHRLNGFGPGDDDDLFRQFDFSGLDDYWECALSEPLEAKIFAHRLNQHFLSASQPSDVKPHILMSLRLARHQHERWFVEDLARSPTSVDDLSTLKVRPREAAEWMLSMPKQRHLVPPSLVSFLEGKSLGRQTDESLGDKHPLEEPFGAAPPRRPRGPVAVKRNAVRARMLEVLASGRDLISEKQEALASEFGASREVCIQALGEALSELKRRNPDK